MRIMTTGAEVLGLDVVSGVDDEKALRAALREQDWGSLLPEWVAVHWEFSDPGRETLEYVEGVLLRVMVHGAGEPAPRLLSDYIGIVEVLDDALESEPLPGDVIEARSMQAEWAETVVRRHGPAMLCEEHGLPPGHELYCDLISKRDRVSHLVCLARWCGAAQHAAACLRERQPIRKQDLKVLDLPNSPPPKLPAGLILEEDLALLRQRLREPVVEGWRRLEAGIAQRREWSEGSLGILPALFDQLKAECAREGPFRVCRRPGCGNHFEFEARQQHYCGEAGCEGERGRQHYANMPRCPSCRRPLSAKRTECRYCHAWLGRGWAT